MIETKHIVWQPGQNEATTQLNGQPLTVWNRRCIMCDHPMHKTALISITKPKETTIYAVSSCQSCHATYNSRTTIERTLWRKALNILGIHPIITVHLDVEAWVNGTGSCNKMGTETEILGQK